jgi:hypothetical protein
MGLWANPGESDARFGVARNAPGHLEAVERLKDWTRNRFHLDDTEVIVVSESTRALPGFPPLDTLVAFWTADGTRHHFRTFKPVTEIVEDDVPPAWLKEALAASGTLQCECC